jgi:pyruvate/2-oxoglutarate dehydrogenase complex dihydrolipoamide acyltransferase (E2) component
VLPSAGTVLVPVEIVEVGPEVNVRALAVEVEEEAEAPEIADQSEPSDAAPAPTPNPRRPPPRNNDDDWMRDLRADLNDTSKERGRRQQEGARSERDQRGAGLGTDERVTLESRAAALVQAHLRRCWRMPADLPEPERLVVVIEFDLNRNGTLNGQPRVVSPRNYAFDAPMRTAVDAAQRAVRACDPYPFPDDPVVGEYYEIWRTNSYRFALRQN